ncbi:PAS domain-containing protein [Chondromyces apiculatus]|uniref:RsbR, positive regulator of sigma-B n=1 Tax=Chondromyces apiculatus DSM 436 TaxID=1192034 RepID=A0A017TAH3_9BACT|nr:PAS domain-containing protein [Chondromyces apiculatus]EYF06234.1 Hypothetical protein CAP_2112 [Chondromyces apiculatus DSM 436]
MGSRHEAQQGASLEALALEISGDGLWELSELTLDAPLRDDAPAYYAPRFCEMLGYTEENFPRVAGSWTAAVVPEDQETFRRAREARIAQQGVSTTLTYRVLTRQGEVRWWQEVGRVLPGEQPGSLRAVGVVRDVTRAERKREHDERHWKLLEYCAAVQHVGGWQIDMEEPDLGIWLDETYRIHEAEIGRKFNMEESVNFYAPEHRPLIGAAYEACVRGTPYAIELDIITCKGNRRHVEATGHPQYKDGKLVNIHGSFRDITEVKRREDELRRQLAVITEQQRDIQALSTPIIQIWDDIITLPLIGNISANRAAQIMDRLLSEVVRVGARFAILDLTGVDTVDTTTADQLCRITRAVDLLGAKVLLCGLNPAVAQTMTALGIELPASSTFRNLQDALRTCLRALSVSLPGAPRGDARGASRDRPRRSLR